VVMTSDNQRYLKRYTMQFYILFATTRNYQDVLTL
jgi:hypothetical protein